jgi:hypothetical protein
MKTNQSESSSDVWRWFQNQADSLGPAVLGSLSLRRSPCVRENCPENCGNAIETIVSQTKSRVTRPFRFLSPLGRRIFLTRTLPFDPEIHDRSGLRTSVQAR